MKFLAVFLLTLVYAGKSQSLFMDLKLLVKVCRQQQRLMHPNNFIDEVVCPSKVRVFANKLFLTD